MSKNVLVLGHSDGDGHLIAEQTRRNLNLVEDFNVEVIVDPKRTQGHQIWTKLSTLPEIEQASLVFFVDLMFSPMGFVEQSQALVEFASERPSKAFFLVDHHPLPYARLSAARNVRSIYRPAVSECCFGPRSGLMVVAALCERQTAMVTEVTTPMHELLALGVRRAAAPGGPLAGAPLLALMRENRWDLVAAIAMEDGTQHRLVRGRRVANAPHSEAMLVAKSVAMGEMKQIINYNRSQDYKFSKGLTGMPYDVEMERISLNFDEPPRYHNSPVPEKDLEILMTLLEVAALSLSVSPQSSFGLDDLIEEARKIGGESIVIDLHDAKTILQKASFLQKVGGRFSLR